MSSPTRASSSGLALILAGMIFSWMPAAQAASGRIHIDVGGQRRSALIIEHTRLKRTPRTAVIVLHGNRAANLRGNPADGRGVRRSLGLEDQLRNSGAILAYPDGLEGRWNLTPGNTQPDDLGFIRALAAKLVSDGLADKRKIFVVGVSTGGAMALRIGCEAADTITGTVALISAMSVTQASTCSPARPIAMMLLSGTADPFVPFNGGPSKIEGLKDDFASAEATLAPFLKVNNCAPQRNIHALPDRDSKDGSQIVIERGKGCKAPVELVRVDGGGHTLPGRPNRVDRGQPLGAQNNDEDTARLVADFIKRASR